MPLESLQVEALRDYTVLHHLQADWGGHLILSLGLNQQGAALAFAANIAGAVCLSLEADTVVAHKALRSGACDFVVNTLNEALRALKNEVRRHLPISVGLQGNQAQILAEIIERGVVPQLMANFTSDPGNSAAIKTLQSQGTLVLDFADLMRTEFTVSAEASLQEVIQRHQWQLESFPQPTSTALRAFDAEALSLISTGAPEDKLRAQWLHAAPKILPRESPLHRALWVTLTEKQQLKKVIESAAHV